MENTTELLVFGYSFNHVNNNVSSSSDIKTLAKGIATPSVAAWNDSIDLNCVKHTERQQHLK